MDSLLCDELLQEIFHRLPPSSSSSSSASAVSLVSKRWLHLYRTSTTSISLCITPHNSQIPPLSSLLSQYPFLSSLSLTFSETTIAIATTTIVFTDNLLAVVSSSCSNLRHLRFLAGPVSLSSLLSLSTACTHLTSLNITLSRPFFFNWLVSFHALKTLSVSICVDNENPFGEFNAEIGNSDVELALESLNLSGIRNDDQGMGWLWRSCRKLKRLQLRSCEGIGDGGSISWFTCCLQNLQEVELRTSRTIIDGVLLKLAENCLNLNSLLVYDGGSKEGLLQFINNCQSNVQKLDFRLPLDLNNDHISAIAQNFQGLSSLRLESCCLVTGDGLKTLGTAMNNGIEELALINCDVVERETGLLTTLGQNLRSLKILDLSHNEMMHDKQFISMLVSCDCLIDLKLRGCKGLTNGSMISLLKNCEQLERLDIVNCCGIDTKAVEFFVLKSPSRLRQLRIEEKKISNNAKTWASRKFIELVFN